MNLKRKLWWAQHRADVYKYGTILSLVLIVTISIIYFTYSKFSSTNEMTMYETTVEPFIKNDYFIASYIDGEWSNEIPGKNDGYVVNKVVCDNGAVGTWDNEEWGINIKNATKKIKCGVYFKKLVKLTEQVTTLASTDTTNFATDDPDNNIRYIGADPNNYVYFNCNDYSNQSDSTCEKWRIIGLFNNVAKGDNSKDNLVKIIRNESIGSFAIDNRSTGWVSAQLMMMLNPKDYLKSGYSISNDVIYDSNGNQIFKNMGAYYNGTVGCRPGDVYSGVFSCSSVDFTQIGFKNDNTRNAIEETIWYYKNVSGTNASEQYKAERNSDTWVGKINLIYISDIHYIGTGDIVSGKKYYDRQYCLGLDIRSSTFLQSIYCGGYLYKLLQNGAVVNGLGYEVYGGNQQAFDGYYRGELQTGIYFDTDYQYAVLPTLYLTSNITILDGDGSETNPYQLNLQ